MKALLAIAVLCLSFFAPAPTAEASPQCKATKYDITICVVQTGSSVSSGRIYEGTVDQFGVIASGFGSSITDTTEGTGDFITPFSTFRHPFLAFCATAKMTDKGACGRNLKPGLKNVVMFDSAKGAFAIHYYRSIGESHGCIRTSWDISKYLFDAYQAGKSIALVYLDRR